MCQFGESKVKESTYAICARIGGTILFGVGVFLLVQTPGQESSVPVAYKGSSVCGLSAIANICRMYGEPLEMTEAYRRAGVPLDHRRGISLLGCKRALEASGIDCEALRFRSVNDLPEGTPILFTLHGRDRRNDRLHATVIMRSGKRVLLVDGHNISVVTSEYLDAHTGHIAVLTKKATLSEKEKLL